MIILITVFLFAMLEEQRWPPPSNININNLSNKMKTKG